MVWGCMRRPFGRETGAYGSIRNSAGTPRRGGVRRALLAAALPLLIASLPAAATTRGDSHIRVREPIAAPDGFAGICARYRWACARSGHAARSRKSELHLARAVNHSINSSTRAISDRRQYGSDEVWALPTATGGDCEDFVLLKKKELVRLGIAPERLLIATVLDRKQSAHAVLVLRTAGGDLVLDNLKNEILPWRQTGYSFLRMQNPAAPHEWDAVLSGGMFQ